MTRSGSFFAPHGLLSRAHPSYEYRRGQEEMARAIERVLRDGGTLMLEAGTGTGKTLAYLVPAMACGRRVIISTGTRNLQDQILGKDLPFLENCVGLEVSASVLKGRDNYLCRYRLAALGAEPLLEVFEERAWIPRIREWSRTTESGDRAEIPDLPDGARFWRDVNARGDTCGGSRCPEFEPCWLTAAKRGAERSQIVVVNHHLFFADLALRTAFGAVLPDYDTVVFDEAHLLEEIATTYFGVQASWAQVEELARDIERLAATARERSRGGAGATLLRVAAQELFLPIRDRLLRASGRIRFEPAEAGGPELERPWAAVSEALHEVERLAARLGMPGAAESVERRAADLRVAFGQVLGREDPTFVYGMEARGRSNVILTASPVDVSGLLKDSLFDRLHASVLTSATLAVDGRFDFFRSRLGLERCETRIVESPFDAERQAILYLPGRMPEPRDPRFIPRAVDEIRALLQITEGRAFLLFTSYAHLKQVHAALQKEGSWSLLVQGEGSRGALVERFRATPRAALLGTASFWHGVDVPGEDLSLVVVDKLPFDVPSDPLVSARIERIRQRGGDPFREYQVPLAALDLKQGLGRLLRSRSDRGILAVLDPRLTTRPYGTIFLRSLPPHPVVRDLAACAAFFRGN